MSMELFVILAAGSAPDVAAWNRALTQAHVPMSIDVADLPKHYGYLPVTLDGKKTGFRSFDLESSQELAEHYPAVAKLKVEQPVVFALGYGDAFEGAAVFYSASVLVATFGGIAFEPQGSVIMNSEDLLNAAKECEAMAARGAE